MAKLTSQLTMKEIKKEIFRMRRELRSSLKEVRDFSRISYTLPTYALKDMREAEKIMRQKAVSKMTKKELISMYRKLSYIQGLKTSTLSGAIEVSKNFEPLRDRLGVTSPKNREKFWDIYRRFRSVTGGTGEKYKYLIFDTEIYDIIIDKLDTGETGEEITIQLLNALEETQEVKAYREEKILKDIFEGKQTQIDRGYENVLFSEKLREILR